VNLDCFIAACVSSWAARVVALPRTIMTAIGGKADMHGRGASTISVAFDPTETFAAKFCCDAQRGFSYDGMVECDPRLREHK
jgi:hypothetical protein